MSFLDETKPVEITALENKDILSNAASEPQQLGLDLVGAVSVENWKEVLEAAVRGEQTEKNLTWREGLRRYRKCIWWSFAMSLVQIMDGYDTALVGALIGLPIFREKFGKYSGNMKVGYQLTPAWQTAIKQAHQIGMFFGVILASQLLPKIGHKRVIQINLVAATGLIFVTFFAQDVQTVFVGQLLCGLPWGAFSTTAISYASEVGPAAVRGYLTTYINLCNVIGQMLAQGVLVGINSRHDQWAYKIPFATQWVWPIPLFILSWMAPESPWWLVRHERLEEAEGSLRRLCVNDDPSDIKNAVALMVRTNQHEINHENGVRFWDLFKGSDLRRTEIAVMGFLTEVFSAEELGGAYFFEQAGLSTADAYKLSLGNSAIGFLGTALSWISMTYIGRRKLRLIGSLVAIVFLFAVGILSYPSASGSSSAKWAQAAILLISNVNTMMNLAPLGYSILAETSSTRLRAQTIGFGRNVHSVAFIVTGFLNSYMINPTAWDWKGYAAFFWMGTLALFTIWAYFRMPEYKGRTYREMDILFEQKVSARKFDKTEVELTAANQEA